MTAATIVTIFVALAHLCIGALLGALVAIVAFGFPIRRPRSDGFGDGPPEGYQPRQGARPPPPTSGSGVVPARFPPDQHGRQSL